MYKQSLLALILFLLQSPVIHSQDTAAIVARAEIVKASEDEIREAKNAARMFASKRDSAMRTFDRFIFIGPRLWDRIKDIPRFKSIQEGNITFKVPDFESDGKWRKTTDQMGKAIQHQPDFKALWEYLSDVYSITTAKLVEKNTRDKFIYWLYFAKVEESCLAIASQTHRFLVQFADGKLFFIELASD